MIGGIEQFPSIDAPNEDEMPLTDVQIKNAKSGEKAQRLFDGGGLYLELSPAGGKLWRLKYRIDSKECQSAPNTFHLSAPNTFHFFSPLMLAFALFEPVRIVAGFQNVAVMRDAIQ